MKYVFLMRPFCHLTLLRLLLENLSLPILLNLLRRLIFKKRCGLIMSERFKLTGQISSLYPKMQFILHLVGGLENNLVPRLKSPTIAFGMTGIVINLPK